jgi:putative hydrolase of the HAD superfamily
LLYPYPSVGEIYAEVMRRHGLDHSPADLEAGFRSVWRSVQRSGKSGEVSENSEWEWWRRVVFAILDKLGHPEDFDALFDELWTSFGNAGHWRLHEGGREILETLSESGYRLGILSNWDSRLRTILDGIGLTAFFDHIIISAEVGFEKPSPEIFRYTEQAFEVSPEACLHIGDSLTHDIHGAAAAGWRAVYIDYSGEPHDGAETVRSLLQLQDLLA